MVRGPFPSNLDAINKGSGDDSSPTVGDRSADPSPGVLGGQGRDEGAATPPKEPPPETSGWMSSGSAPKVAALLPCASAFPISYSHSSIECSRHPLAPKVFLSPFCLSQSWARATTKRVSSYDRLLVLGFLTFLAYNFAKLLMISSSVSGVGAGDAGQGTDTLLPEAPYPQALLSPPGSLNFILIPPVVSLLIPCAQHLWCLAKLLQCNISPKSSGFMILFLLVPITPLNRALSTFFSGSQVMLFTRAISVD